MKRLELTTNIAILCFIALFCGLMVRNMYHHPASKPIVASVAKSHKGEHIVLPGSDFSHSDKTLVVAAATYCHFCVDSAPFYKRLTTLRDKHEIKTPVVLAFPQAAEDTKAFLTRFQLHPDAVVSTPLDNLGVEGTPTLLLVDSKGSVINEWVGKLPRSEEDRLIQQL